MNDPTNGATQASPEPLLPPLRLPRFTFLLGGDRTTRRTLADLLCERDRELLMLDFEEPLRMATTALFFGAASPLNVDLTDPRTRELRPLDFEPTYADFLADLNTWLDARFGGSGNQPSAIGLIGVAAWERDNNDLVFERYLYIDAESHRDVNAFAIRFPGQCLVAQCGPIVPHSFFHESVRHVWLPALRAEAKLIDLERQLNP